MGDHASGGPAITLNNPLITGGVFNAIVVAADDDDGDGLDSGGGRMDSGQSTRRNVRPPAVYQPRSLESIVAFDALLNSGERYPAPKCHPETRKAALEIVMSWIWNRPAGFNDIMWVSGAPGVGKSALLQTVCEILAGAYNPIHASFFFGRGHGARELAASLPPTIAYQFTISSIICRWYTWYLLRNDPTVLREAFHSQFRKLVIAPASTRSYIQYPMVVVIDGLDECVNVQDRVALLELIFEAANTKSIRFLIASRPEQEIENFFKRPDVAQHVNRIILDEETFQTSKDIRIFLRSEFARIRQSRPELLFPTVDGKEWPGDAIIDRTTVDSDGQFIFSTLFIGYLDDDLFSPQDQLECLLNPPAHVAAFSKLDRLYHQILTRRPRLIHQEDAKFAQYQETVKDILRIIIAWPGQSTIAEMARVLREEVHVVHNIVRGPLRTLFKFEGLGVGAKVTFCHKSLGDCLLDHRRSGQYHVPQNALDLIYLRMLSRPLLRDPAQMFSREQLVGVLQVLVAWPEQLSVVGIASVLDLGSNTVDRVIMPFIEDFVESKSRLESFRDFLRDPNRSREFHVPPNALDLLYLRILSRRPPSAHQQSFSQEELVAVLHAVVAWPEPLTKDKIASVTKLGSDTVTNIITPLLGLVLKPKSWDLSVRCDPFENFLLDPDRSREFHVPPNALDLLYLRILSRRPPSAHQQSFSQEELVAVLHAVVAWPKPLTKDKIASITGLGSDTVPNIVTSLQGLLFKSEYSGLTRPTLSFKEFLQDPDRSRQFYVPPNALELLHLHMLSFPPPFDLAQTFSRPQILAVQQTGMERTWPTLDDGREHLFHDGGLELDRCDPIFDSPMTLPNQNLPDAGLSACPSANGFDDGSRSTPGDITEQHNKC